MRGFGMFSHHRHSGRLRPHGETSFAALGFLMLLSGVVLLGASGTTQASTTGGALYTVQAVVPGPKPTGPATITSPANGQSFPSNPVTISGTCPAKSLVKVFTNNVLIGSAICDASRHFSLQATLVIGQNQLTALPYNTNDESGPASPTVTVTLNAPPGGPGFSTELLLQSINYYRGSVPGQLVTWPITIVGGVGPYAVSFDWGDGKSDLISRAAAGPFDLTHTYNKPGGYLGSYPLIIKASDTAGHTAYLQLTTIVNDPIGVTSSVTSRTQSWIIKLLIWPLWVVLGLMIAAFWLGERREKHVLRAYLEATA